MQGWLEVANESQTPEPISWESGEQREKTLTE
jgi:hypothetical protein